MPNMKTKGQRNLKLLGGQEKTDGRPDGRTDKLIPVYPPYNFVVRGYNKTYLILRNERLLNFFIKIIWNRHISLKLHKHIRYQTEDFELIF
jgi:hypothetical protein